MEKRKLTRRELAEVGCALVNGFIDRDYSPAEVMQVLAFAMSAVSFACDDDANAAATVFSEVACSASKAWAEASHTPCTLTQAHLDRAYAAMDTDRKGLH